MTFYTSEPHGLQGTDDHSAEASDAGPRIDRAGEVERAGEAHEFRLDPARNLLHMRIAGFWTRDTVARFAGDLKAAIALLGCAPGEHLICCDVSDAAIQAQEVVAAFQELIVHGPTRARKMALFTSRVLPRMQARRIVAVRDNIAFFDTEARALQWLFADDPVTT